MANAWASEPQRQPAELHVMSRLSDTMIQSVKLRASGADSYVQPSPFPTKLSFERRQFQFDVYQPQIPSSTDLLRKSGDPDSPAYVDRNSPLPSLLTLSVGTQRGDVDSASSSLKRLGKRSRHHHSIAADHGREDPGQEGVSSCLTTVSSPNLPPAPNSETRRESSAAASSISRVSNARENRERLTLSETMSAATGQDDSTVLSSTTVTSMKLLSATAASAAGSAASATSAEAKPKKKRIRIKTERRREQCRANQARYRSKQRALRLAFHETLDRLRDEVSELEAKRRALAYGLHIKKSPWNVVADYFRLFHRGACVRTNEYFGAPSPADRSVHSLYMETEYGEEQLAFLRSVMAPDVNLVGSDANGVDALAEQWIVWSRSCNAFEMNLERIEKAPGQRDTLAATTTVCVTISDSTVRNVFLHLLSRQGRGEGGREGQSSDSELAWKLCGQRLEFKCVMWFECNPRTSQVLRLRSQFDIVPPLLSVLGSLRDVARVLDGARLASDGFFRGECWQQSGAFYGGSRRDGSASCSSSFAGRGTSRNEDEDDYMDD